jgi:UDP-N-acetylmuramate-alanine ligase
MDAIAISLQKDSQNTLAKEHMYFEKDIQQLASQVLHHVQDDDVVITMGAGSIGNIPNQIIKLVNVGESMVNTMLNRTLHLCRNGLHK